MTLTVTFDAVAKVTFTGDDADELMRQAVDDCRNKNLLPFEITARIDPPRDGESNVQFTHALRMLYRQTYSILGD